MTDEDLENGLYYMGCHRDAIFVTDAYEVEYMHIFPEQAGRDAARAKIRAAIEVAEQAGRVIWRIEDGFGGCRSYTALNALLEQNGYGAVEPDRHSLNGEILGNPQVRDQVQAAGLNLRVIPAG